MQVSKEAKHNRKLIILHTFDKERTSRHFTQTSLSLLCLEFSATYFCGHMRDKLPESVRSGDAYNDKMPSPSSNSMRKYRSRSSYRRNSRFSSISSQLRNLCFALVPFGYRKSMCRSSQDTSWCIGVKKGHTMF